MKKLSSLSIALSNLSYKINRTFSMLLLTSLCAASVFACAVLSFGLKNGISTVQKRLGADLMIVPEGAEQKMQSVLISGEPNYFYMEKEIAEKISQIEGVEKVTSRFYLTSVSEDCCDFPVQIVGFEPETDFVISPWIEESFPPDSKKITEEFYKEGCVVTGTNVLTQKDGVRFFGKTHPVSGRLSKSGAGIDNAVFVSMNTLKEIYDDAKGRGFGFISDGEAGSKVSAVFVRLSEGAKADSTSVKITSRIPNVSVVKRDAVFSEISSSLDSVFFILKILAASVTLFTVISLAIIFPLAVSSRTAEFSILRILGAAHKKCAKILLCEALFISVAGGLSGIALACLLVFPFCTAIDSALSVPLVFPPPAILFLTGCAVILAVILAVLLSALKSIIAVSKLEPYSAMKQG
ncbi:ABC transporter permease [Treponema sp.]|uniref:ABC transporter permease n=1 Tax=Treponema sp. TaxID=166 RepID=UPI003F057523